MTKDQNITAKFKKRHYPFTEIFELSPTGGTISVTGYSDQDYLYFGESISFTANQLDHWEFEYWDDLLETDLSRSITIDSSNPTIEATFSLSYDLNVSVSPSGFGSITSGTNQTLSSGSFIHEDIVSLTATPIPGKNSASGKPPMTST